MSKMPWAKFFWSDWSNDSKLKLCSLAAQGIWMRMLCIASESVPVGYVAVGKTGLDNSAIAKLSGASVEEVAELVSELERNDVFSRTSKGTIYCRRMVRDAKKAQTARENGAKGGNPSLSKQRDISASDNPRSGNIPEARSLEARDNNQDSHLDKDLATSAKPPQPSRQPPKPKPVGNADFNRFWSAYPRKVKRPDAEKALAKALRRAPIEKILDGLEAYKKFKPDYADWAHPASWLNNDRWSDEYASVSVGNSQPLAATDWRKLLGIFCTTRTWQWGALSPEPGATGCKIPAEIIAEFSERLPESPLAPASSGPRLSLVPSERAA